jgi:rfaE bifunctional protein kinase chain/domain
MAPGPLRIPTAEIRIAIEMQLARSIHPLPGNSEHAARLLALIDSFGGRRLVVIGDIIADEFIYGQVARVSREAPVLILKYDSTEIVGGGAANAANNAAALGAEVTLVGVAGRDEAARRLLKSLHARVAADAVVRPNGYRTPVKTRILAGGVHSAKQQVVRIDRESAGLDMDAARNAVTEKLGQALARCDAVLVSDYGSGLVTPAVVRHVVRELAERTRRRRVPVLLDSRYNLLAYRGLTACTPNENEVEQILGVRIDDNPQALADAGRAILKRTKMEAVLVTRGSRGMALFEPNRPTEHIPIYGSDEIADVTGAGDTVIATVTLALAAGASFYEAARLANYAGGVVVMKRGTATVSEQELRGAVENAECGMGNAE